MLSGLGEEESAQPAAIMDESENLFESDNEEPEQKDFMLMTQFQHDDELQQDEDSYDSDAALFENDESQMSNFRNDDKPAR